MSTVDAHPLAAEHRLGRPMTEEQFVAWAARTERRAEWVDGEVELMNAVEWGHLDLTWFLVKVLGFFVDRHRLGKMAGEPYQFRRPGGGRRRQPDLFHVPVNQVHLIDRMQFNGLPDLIIEVVSPDSQRRDRRTKFGEYERAGTLEYWLPDPGLRTFDAFRLGPDRRYAPVPLLEGRFYSTVLTGAYFEPAWLRQPQLPDPWATLESMCAERARLLGSSPPPPASDKPSG